MSNEPYSKREQDNFFEGFKEQLDRIEVQTTKHNTRLTKVERYLLIVGCVTGTIFILNGSELVGFFFAVI